MKTPAGSASAELEVRKSRFLARLEPIAAPEDARRWVKAWREEHPRARHVVHAFVLSREGVQTKGASDDGEPPGTGGRPVLELLRSRGLTGVCVGVIRYFGGVLLGTGPLARAYSDAAALAVEAAEWKEVIPGQNWSLTVVWGHRGVLERWAAVHGVSLRNWESSENLQVTAFVPQGLGEIWQIALEDWAGRGFVVDFFSFTP